MDFREREMAFMAEFDRVVPPLLEGLHGTDERRFKFEVQPGAEVWLMRARLEVTAQMHASALEEAPLGKLAAAVGRAFVEGMTREARRIAWRGWLCDAQVAALGGPCGRPLARRYAVGTFDPQMMNACLEHVPLYERRADTVEVPIPDYLLKGRNLDRQA